MAKINILKIPKKEAISCTMQAKSIIIAGKSKSGKSTLCSQAPKPIFLMTENGVESLQGMVPVPISSWADFTDAVRQLCSKEARETFETVVIDTYTNLLLLLDKYVAPKLSAKTKNKEDLDFGSEADYGAGARAMKNELGIQLQKLSNQGYLIMNIVHAEDKVDFKTGEAYIGTSLSESMFGVAEKFVDQIIYLKREKPNKEGKILHNIYFNTKGGFEKTGGRLTPEETCVPCTYKNLEIALVRAMEKKAEELGVEKSYTNEPVITIELDPEDKYDLPAMKKEFTEVTSSLMKINKEAAIGAIKEIVDLELGSGRKVADLTIKQAELLEAVLNKVKELKIEAENGEESEEEK